MRHIRRTLSYFIKPATAALLAGAFPVVSPAQAPSVVTDDGRVSPDKFVIFPWDRLPGGKGKFSEAYECGFNVAGFVPAELLDEASSAGLEAFVTDPLVEIRGAETLSEDDISSRVRAVTQKTRTHPAVFGYHLLDEPEAKLFPVIAKWVKAFQAEVPDAIIYTNLLPHYGPKPGPGGPFEEYLASFMKTVQPKAFSYDHYALFEDGTLRDAYFPNLETARKVSLETNIPFWHIVLGNAHFNYAEPTEATCRFQAYTSLAYGARGIGWFTYQARERGNYRRSAIDHYGRRTDTFAYIRDANLQMHRLAPTLSAMKSINVFHHPPLEGTAQLTSSRFLDGLDGNGPFLVGEFEGKEQKAILIVNKSLVASTSFRPRTKANTAFRKISATSGESIPWSAENNWLAPGQGMLLVLK